MVVLPRLFVEAGYCSPDETWLMEGTTAPCEWGDYGDDTLQKIGINGDCGALSS